MGSVLGSVTSAVFAIGTVAVFALGAYFYRAGSMTLGTVFLMFQYTAMLRQHLGQIQRQARDFQSASASIARVQELLDTPAGLPRPGVRCSATDRSASSSTASRSPTASSRCCATSRSGWRPAGCSACWAAPAAARRRSRACSCGCTTRQAGACASAQLTAGIDVRDVAPDELRRRIGMVTQEVQLFHATVRDNLTLFDPRFRTSGSWTRSIGSGCRPGWRGCRTRSGTCSTPSSAPGGGGLSAGEAQLLAFARVFLRDPGLVILDEASSRLDPGTERLLERAVDRLLAGRTAI